MKSWKQAHDFRPAIGGGVFASSPWSPSVRSLAGEIVTSLARSGCSSLIGYSGPFERQSSNAPALSGAISFESNTPAVSEVAVWATRSLLTHTTVSPNATLSACGRNCMPSIVTVRVTGRGAVAAAGPMARSTRHRAPANMTLRMAVLRGKDRARCRRRRDAPQNRESRRLGATPMRPPRNPKVALATRKAEARDINPDRRVRNTRPVPQRGGGCSSTAW